MSDRPRTSRFLSERPVPAGYRAAYDVQRELGIAAPTFRLRLRELNVPIFRNPSDGRMVLLKEEDAVRLLTPTPLNLHRRTATTKG